MIKNEIDFKKYNLNDYIHDVETIGLKKTWNKICNYCITNIDNIPEFIAVKNFGELYEIGLATQDKLLKKKNGQYYTPDDVALVMSKWLDSAKGTNVCDVACGTGKLILTYLEFIGYDRARELISSGRLYLYDYDDVALGICYTAISILYGLDISGKINCVHCDFLDKNVKLPECAKVISNPPYARLEAFNASWEITSVLKDTKEFYSAFMEKIFKEAKSTVIITPFSFISGSKFYSLRKEMCELGNGFIVSFDNVPGNIFCGRKHGIFNTNTANSVRAAITVFEKNIFKGFRLTSLIRFKNKERNALLKCNVLENLLGKEYQCVDESNPCFKKIDNDLHNIFNVWNSSKAFLKDCISKKENDLIIDVPNTCRYYTTGCSRKLNRNGSITLYIEDKKLYGFIYCFINSSFTYWWWRIFDGGITYPVSLLKNMPIPIDKLSNEDIDFFDGLAKEMINKENEYIVTKVNAGTIQENIKFPDKYRIKINQRILEMLEAKEQAGILDKIHSNRFLSR